ncbi:MAG TPA: hypothetical protein VI524_13640 [Anaerolineales bacterium]|nr:hypothetical protein [Anaerolineales bacterium]
MFFQETTPDTSGYMIAGYAAAFLVMALYVLSLYLRSRNLRQDMSMLEEFEDSSASPEAGPERPAQKIPSRAAGTKPKTVTKRARKK